MTSLVTVGHGTLTHDELAALLTGAGITSVVDIRRFPGSRRHPDLARDALALSLPAAGIDYRWEPRLGGRRHLTKAEDAASPDRWWRVAAFRAYAGYTRTEEFRAGLRSVLDEAGDAGAVAGTGGGSDKGSPARVAILCSESVWWRCHRRLVADVAALAHGAHVEDLMHDGRRTPHEVSAGARLVDPDQGRVVWDGDG